MVHGTMNHMKTQETQKLHQLAAVVGEFIRYWGFRKIHGEIWTVVFLSQAPLSGVEIGRILKVSKALVSPALKELIKEGLIQTTQSENSKTKRYEAHDNVSTVIRGVLRRREQRMLADAAAKHVALLDVARSTTSLNSKRIETLGTLIQTAQFSLAALVNEDDFWTS